MTATQSLTDDLKKQVIALEDDLRRRVDEDPAVLGEWQRTHRQATEQERTAWSWTQWRDDRVNQTAVAWVLMSVFIRFCEDNALVKPVWITGPGRRRQEALDAELAFFREHPKWTEREWLEDAIAYLGKLPATRALVDSHSALRYASPSGGAVEDLIKFWRDRSDDGTLIHDLQDETLSTRFLGDLYQDLSQHAKDTYALLQTPVFVEEHILDRTLEPALRERPLEGFRMIDPTCGSGHFLLGAFDRLLDRWHKQAPAMEIQARVQSALDAIHGVDLNPFAVAIARFRLTVAALQACDLRSLEDAPAFKYHLAVGDSLIHGPDANVLPGMEDRGAFMPFHYATEDAPLLLEILEEGRYDTVVGNPPYITVKDKALNKIYRSKFGKVCKGTYALTVPFMVQFFALAKRGERSGWVGQITSNSFMKREFGALLIEDFLPRLDLRLIEDTKGAFIPGHSTSTVIIVGRNQPPAANKVRAVLGLRGEPGRPDDPSNGNVWTSINQHSDDVGWKDEWITVADLDRKILATHPWNLSGDGAIQLVEAIERAASRLSARIVPPVGRSIRAGADEAFVRPIEWSPQNPGLASRLRVLLTGEDVRDWVASPELQILYPYVYGTKERLDDGLSLELWPLRTVLANRGTFSGDMEAAGLEWWELQYTSSAYTTPMSIVFAEVATHNHFVLDRGGKVFKQTAPVIKLPADATEDDHFELLGILNSSTICFWLRQVCFSKGGATVSSGLPDQPWSWNSAFNSSNVAKCPIPSGFPSSIGRRLDSLSTSLATDSPSEVCRSGVPTTSALSASKHRYAQNRASMIFTQEELDWASYSFYKLIDEDLTYSGRDIFDLALGERSFEIALARTGEQTEWFDRHESLPITEIPAHWPTAYRELVQRRLQLIAEHPYIRLLEQPEYKRRWSQESWDKRQGRALRGWLLDRLEDRRFWFDPAGGAEPKSVGQLADEVTRDKDMVSVLAVWEGRPDVPVTDSLVRLLADEAVPFLAAYRYQDSGLRTRAAWEETWELQRREDRGEKVSTIPVPPKYTSADFRKSSYWRARGKLDVPKERFILYPDANRQGDPTTLLGWAGWDHAEQSLALSRIIGEREQEGWDDERLVPLVAGLAELQPWVDQWHSAVDERYGVSLAAFCREQLDQRAAQVGRTLAELADWRPVPSGRGRAGEGRRGVSVLLSDVLDIPLAAGDEDYVLRLTDGIDQTRIAATIDEYVVTPELVQAFDSALGLVAEAMTTGVSRGAFLSGSFGSGKSHFMAVLYALLRHNGSARAKPELQPVVDKHDAVLREANMLPLAFHLLAAESLEQALFSGYVRQVRALHPGAPLPALYMADALLVDADRMRARIGDDGFFAGLNGGAEKKADQWSGLLGDNVTWTAGSYAAAKAAAPGSGQRQQLVTALTREYFASYTQRAEFVDLDTGLSVIAEHAKSLGHDAVVLFLDELVLWLAFGVQDREFFRRESQKLTKLVEAGMGPRAVPLISFVARQMDLRRWFADAGASGAEQEALDRAFRHQEGRFGTIVLGDNNLPYVAHRRLLRKRADNPQAELVLRDAFARINRSPAIWDVLLDGINTDDQHRGADEEAFRLTYPFSPALVSTLRDLASVMQRERTALKVMQQMLVDRRETLTVDDVIPVGDSFDYIVSGSQPLDAQAAALFKSANALYQDKLRPLILSDNGLTEGDAGDPGKLTAAFRAHDRLAKTLLLSAVAPRVPALKELTASRLASLNHGSIRSPLPGSEAGIVLAKVKEWNRRIPEIHVGADPKNPVIRVQLSDVDYESVVENAKGEDNDGRRRELIKDLVREALGVAETSPDVFGAYQHTVTWRGSRRSVDLVFGNVRDATWLTDDHFRARAGSWRFVIDFPYDDPGFSSAQDLARLDQITDRGPRERVIAWLPHFLSEDRMRDVRKLVILDWLLTGTGDRWRKNADHLSEVDRAQARAILESQRTALREGLRRAIQEAYGAARSTPGTLAEDTSHDRVLVSLDAGFVPAAPVGADLGAAFRNLVDQAFGATFPAHPRFEPGDTEVTVRDLAAVYAHVERAVADPEGRVRLEGADIAGVRRVANALGVGQAAETHFLFGDDRFAPWAAEFERAAARDGIRPEDTVTVAQLRRWIDAMTPPFGLRDEVADLVILAWAALRTRAWYDRGGPVPPPRPGGARPEMELRPEPLPAPADWRKATTRAEALFGLHVNPYLTAAGVAELAVDIQQRVGLLADDASGLVPQVELAYRQLGLDPAHPGRLATARAGSGLLDGLRRAGGDRVRLIEALGGAQLPCTEAALANSLTRARVVAEALRAFRWDRLTPLREAEATADDRGRSAARTLNTLREAVRADEFASRIDRALSAAEEALFEWLSTSPKPEPPPGPGPRPGPGPVPGPAPGWKPVPTSSPGAKTRAAGQPDDSVLVPLKEFLRSHPNENVVVEWRVTE